MASHREVGSMLQGSLPLGVCSFQMVVIVVRNSCSAVAVMMGHFSRKHGASSRHILHYPSVVGEEAAFHPFAVRTGYVCLNFQRKAKNQGQPEMEDANRKFLSACF